ncbi:MAG: isoprenylcysteine carboxylmethyltransferase family protein [Steroidobacteraceae bacterium]
MRRTRSAWGSALYLVAAPGVLAGLVPWWITRWNPRPPFLGLELTRVAGAVLIAAGALELVDSFGRFALQGLGTPAPIAPTRHLVVTGAYRYVRNPMYLAVAAVILGQAVLLSDWRLIFYAALIWLACHMFVVRYEEPVLLQTFGAEYESFRANVRRWIPRVNPWRAESRRGRL